VRTNMVNSSAGWLRAGTRTASAPSRGMVHAREASELIVARRKEQDASNNGKWWEPCALSIAA